ncbi:hydrogen peroxide-inducible genes activator [Thalassovita mediterranea]|jgi:LysR family hydrogen peroxide-inducible transcriptional activator|uniref:Morphology and auto-aggregation control protein n=1 Tax=Thalassovita mediterranea TaxID=340021 RepID=A0A0P1H2P6_9RHOB|nr:hydrogen peroxide-inducible genes activator [Thalassovita mediterranea]CUH84485.1 Morphology and auto-aggregation control protein [Thalassovita mediterranea]SIS34324.1 LysR family transcriptional regulator, hydrogen peroxide-inducible genes activator [Thalassovita mediterranea]
MNNITLRQLRYFEAVARLSHFGQAAEACAVSQPALSVQIKELEETIGAKLFERGARQVRLTRMGEEFAGRVQHILRSVDELGDLARAGRDRLVGRLRIGVIPTIAPYLLPSVVEVLARDHPDIDLRLRETITPRLIDELKEGSLDIAIVALPISEPAFKEVPLFEEEFVLVRPQRDADQPVPGPDRLREMRLLLLEEGHCFRDQALSFCAINRSAPRELLDGSSLSTLVQMVGAGIGVTLIPDMAVAVETRSANVAVAHFPDPAPKRQIGMVWRKSNPLTKELEQVAAAVQRAATALGLGV